MHVEEPVCADVFASRPEDFTPLYKSSILPVCGRAKLCTSQAEMLARLGKKQESKPQTVIPAATVPAAWENSAEDHFSLVVYWRSAEMQNLLWNTMPELFVFCFLRLSAAQIVLYHVDVTARDIL